MSLGSSRIALLGCCLGQSSHGLHCLLFHLGRYSFEGQGGEFSHAIHEPLELLCRGLDLLGRRRRGFSRRLGIGLGLALARRLLLGLFGRRRLERLLLLVIFLLALGGGRPAALGLDNLLSVTKASILVVLVAFGDGACVPHFLLILLILVLWLPFFIEEVEIVIDGVTVLLFWLFCLFLVLLILIILIVVLVIVGDRALGVAQGLWRIIANYVAVGFFDSLCESFRVGFTHFLLLEIVLVLVVGLELLGGENTK